VIRESEHVILITNIWLMIVPLLLGIIGFSFLLVGLVKRDRIHLILSVVCLFLLVIFFGSSTFFYMAMLK
jgi:hypothetical protein